MFSDEDFRRVLFDASSDCILVLDAEGRVLVVNEACRRLMELAGATYPTDVSWIERWPPAARKNVSEALQAARAGATVRFQDFCLTTGAQKWWDVCVAPMTTGADGAIQLLCVCRDITDIRMTENELLEREAQLRLGGAVAGLALSKIDYKQNVTVLSAEAAGLLGLGDEPMTVPRSTVQRMFHPDDHARVMEAVREAHDPAGPGWFELDVRIIQPSGSIRWHRARQQVIFEGEGAERRPSHAILAAFDITKEKKTEEALQRNKAFLGAMLDALPHHVAVLGEDGTIIAVNESWARFGSLNGGSPENVGLGVDYLASTRAAAAAGDFHARRAYDGINAILSGKSEGFVLEYPCHVADREQWFMLHATRLSWPPAAVILSHTNITERIRSEQRLREAEARLRESDRNKDEFIATLAHELRNPLAPLRSGLQFLRQARPGDPGLARMRDIMERQVGHLMRLVDDLLDISRISRGKVELRKEQIDVAVVARQAIADVRAHMEAKNLAIQLGGLDEPLPMAGDPVRVSQIILNLLDNAIKYSAPGGTILIDAQRDGPDIRISVRDTGAGISPEILPKIFDLFTQGESLTGGRAGLGIGLALVRKLVEMHGGAVEAQSDGVGRGARFLVRLPASKNAAPARVEIEAALPPGVGGCRALLIDDNQDVADSLALTLKRWGFVVEVAYSGADGLARAACFAPNLVLLDLGMPVMDGYQTARALRALPGGDEIELVALTGWGEEQTRRRVKEAGFDGHLIKPARAEDIVAIVLTREPAVAKDRRRIPNPGKMA